MKRYGVIIISFILLLSTFFPFGGEWKVSAASGSPVTTHNIIGNRHVSGIYYGSVEVQFIVHDSGAGVAETRYSLNDGVSWSTYSAPLIFSEKKVHHILYQSIDNNNNVEEPKVADFTIKQDQFPPETTVDVLGTKGQNSYYISPVTISLNGTDDHSAIDYSEYSFDGGQTWNRYLAPFPIDSQSNTLVYYRSRDIDGNLEKMQKHKVNLDLISPTQPDFMISPEQWSNSTFTVTIFDGIDDQSGTFKSQYRVGSSETWLDYTTPFSVSGNDLTTVFARTVDYAGNTSEVAEYTLQFDKIAPTSPSIELSNSEWTNEDVYVSVYGGSDAESLVRGYDYMKGTNSEWLVYGGRFSVKEEGITNVYARTVDMAGNVSPSSQREVKIDLTPPTAPESIFKVSQLGTSVFIRWSPGADNLSGISEYDVYNGETLLATTKENKVKLQNLIPGETYSITVRSVDNAGNVSNDSKPLDFFVNSITVSAYRDHNFAWNQQGNVWGWGLNNRGQLGDGTISDKNIATSIPALDGFSMISTGFRQNIGLRSDGTVWTWGEDYREQAVPLTKIEGLENIVSISSGLLHYLALKDDGTVWAWGSNDLGQLGNGTINNASTPIQVIGLDSVVSITGSYYNSMALREDGTVWIWGDGIRGVLGYNAPIDYKQLTPIQIKGLENVMQVDMSYLHGAALKKDGTVWTWGFNESGQLGDGSVADHATPYQVQGLAGVVKISASYAHTLALTKDGKVWSWGNNYYGEIGDGSGVQKRLVPVRAANLEGIVDIEAGELYSLATKKNGSIWAWGNNMYGQLGNGTKIAQITRTLVSGIPFPTDTIPPSVPGQLKTTGKTSATVVLSWEESTDNHAVKEYLIYKGGALLTTLGVDGKSIDSSTGYTVTGLTAGTQYKFTVKAKDYAGNISASSNEVTATTEVSLPIAVSAGANHTLALKSDGSVWAWGNNGSGQLGDGYLSSLLLPKQAINVTSITAVSTGNAFSLALKSDGTVWGWGQNTIGQLGNTALNPQQTNPKKIEAFDSVIAISAGSTHALALKSDGTVWAWGSNFNGELGNGTTNNLYVPTKISSLTNVKAISAGMFYSLALKTDGTVWAWGGNDNGQLGDGTTTNRLVPVKISSLSGVDSITAGLYHALALKQDGTVWSWGYNSYGQLGDGTYSNRMTPVKVGSLSGIKQISAGMYHSLAKSASSVYAWGYNNSGQLGNNGYSNSALPVTVSSLTVTKDIEAGFNHNAVVTSSDVMTWGDNASGQLGNGTSVSSKIPVLVKGLVPTVTKNNQDTSSQSTLINEGGFPQEDLMLPDSFMLPDLIAPSAPTDITAQINNGQLTLSWKESTDNIGVKEYWIYVDQRLLLKTGSTSAVDLQYPNRGFVTFTIRAVDEAGNVSIDSIPFTP